MENVYNRVLARAPKNISLKIMFYQDLPFLWYLVATQLSGRTLTQSHRVFPMAVNQTGRHAL
jgi:hypothetical protein